MKPAATTNRSSGITGIIAVLAGAHFAHHVLTALLVPLLPFIRNEFALSYAQSGAVTSAFTVAYGVAQLPAGWLSDRIGPRYMLLIGISGVAAAGVFVGLSPAFGLLIAGLLLMGVAGGGYHPAASAVISRFVTPERRGRALGVHIVGGSTSHFVAPLIAAGLVSLLGWRGSFLALSAPVAILGVVIFVMIQHRIHHADGYARAQADAATEERAAAAAESVDAAEAAESAATVGTADGSQTDADAPNARDSGTARDSSRSAPRGSTALRMTFFLILSGVTSAAVASTIPFIPLYLVDIRGVDDRIAAGFISIIFGAGFFAAPLGGWLSDVFGRVRVMVAVGLLSAPLLALIPVTPFPILMFVLLLAIGTLMFTRMPTAEAHIASEVSERHRTTVLGIYFFSGMEGSALLTPLLGSAIDRWGFDSTFSGLGLLLGGLVVVCGVVLVVLYRGQRAPAGRA
jgi:MFS family permease